MRLLSTLFTLHPSHISHRDEAIISDACLVMIVIFALLAHSFMGYLAFAKRREYTPSKMITSFLGVYTFAYPNLFAMPIHLRLSHYIFDAVENQGGEATI